MISDWDLRVIICKTGTGVTRIGIITHEYLRETKYNCKPFKFSTGILTQ